MLTDKERAKRVVLRAWDWMKDSKHWVKNWENVSEYENNKVGRTCLLGALNLKIRNIPFKNRETLCALISKARWQPDDQGRFSAAVSEKPAKTFVNQWFQRILNNLEA